MNSGAKFMAKRLAIALRETTTSYLAGYMARQTWKTHMQHLWAQVDSCGVRNQVVKILGIK